MKSETVKVKASELLNSGNITVTIEQIQKELKEGQLSPFSISCFINNKKHLQVDLVSA